jgi:hypothetical protein
MAMPLLSPTCYSGRDCRETCRAGTRCFAHPGREILITEPRRRDPFIGELDLSQVHMGSLARHNDQLLLDPDTNRGARFKVVFG